VGGGTPACVVARLSYADTVDIAGVAFRLVCAYPKPRFWARRRPEFLTARRPDVTVAITYDEHFRRRAGWPAGGETVDDATHVRGHGRRLRVTTGYYRAAIDVRRGRAAVRIAAGFDVGHLMRTLAALWLLERNTLLLRAGPAGYVAVAPREGEMTVRLTPFGDHGAQPGSARPRAVPIVIGTAGSQAAGPQGSARALAALLPAIWQADRRRAAVTRTLELASLIIAARRRRDGDARPAGSALVG
jgi:hypothetical protein